MTKTFGDLLNRVREKKPLVHHITNYVTATDCANVTLGIGASPVMADAIGEVDDIAAISNALVLNMGTLNERTIPSMLAAGKAANAKNIPVVFDPVGAGASKLRNDTATSIISEVKLAVLRGNISEIKFVAGLGANTKGVGASESDISAACDSGSIAKTLAQKLNCIVVISGAVDIISDGEKIAYVENGNEMMANITGTGCMCSSLLGSFCGAAREELFAAAAAAMLSMSISGELAFEKAGHLGNGSFRVALLDAIANLDAQTLERRAKYREV
ncbi:MAG: hydroxyethylthiazole kinase [Treponema sp.]|jgi:hydroxyethylthiazole kinase|nr:hydroxyethylthiazole kinase [Treponema sp.]